MVPEDIIEIWVLAIQQANREVISQQAVARAEVPQLLQEVMQERQGVIGIDLPDELMPAQPDIENEFERSERRATELFDQEGAQDEINELNELFDLPSPADNPDN